MVKNTTAVGHRAEALAAEYLMQKGYRLLARNDRTRFAEIDLIMLGHGEILFVEVKYRKSDRYGGGSGAITPDKLRRLRNAAEAWLAEHEDYADLQPRIDVVTVTGSLSAPQVDRIENITA